MVEQDYIMRLIKELVRTLLKLLFQIDLENPYTEVYKENEEKSTLQALIDLIDRGLINDAENQLYDLISESSPDNSQSNLKTALLFYAYLNEKNNAYLEANDFSREEVRQGLKYVIDQYSLHGLAEAFLSEE
ncbi:MAG: hypothetical protein HFH30_06030 [Eubacterium sp.]|nr:hypothetical protein [Eubacterium sp.]